MVLADKKKANNLSEYIIFMYQTELLVRNFELDIEKIKLHVIQNIPDQNIDREALSDWYADVISEMKAEKLEKEGHLNSVQDEVKRLSDLSMRLQVEDENYRQVFQLARPHIRESIQASEGLINDPIQACLNGVFGLLLTRMNGKEIPEATMQSVEHFGNVLSYLSQKIKES